MKITRVHRQSHFGKCHLERRHLSSVVSQQKCPGSAVATCCSCSFHTNDQRHLPRRSSAVFTTRALLLLVRKHLAYSNDSTNARCSASMEAVAAVQRPLANIHRDSHHRQILDKFAHYKQTPGAFLPSSDPLGPPASSTQKNLVHPPTRERPPPPTAAVMAETAGSPIGIANVRRAHHTSSGNILTARVAAQPAPQDCGQARCCLYDNGSW